MTSFVGNDLIDFAADHNRGRAHQTRILERVLSVGERERMAPENAGDHGFALFWSAKEAAYKAAVKSDPALVFAPRRWQVEVDSLAPWQGDREGVVVLDQTTRVPVRWQQGDSWLHCIALLGEPPAIVEQAVAVSTAVEAHGEFSAAERQGFTSPDSAAVRHLAKRLLQRHGIDEIEVRRATSGRGLLPPAVYRDGARLPGIDLSLSHDGRFVAAVVIGDTEVGTPH